MVNLTGRIYPELLGNIIHPALVEIIENNNEYMANHLIFQQYGVAPHYSLTVSQYLNQTFPEQWFGKRRLTV